MKLIRDKLDTTLKTRYQLTDNTLTRAVKVDPADQIELELGDAKQPQEFLPQAKIKRWDNETNFSIRWKTDDPAEPELTTEDDTITYRKGKQAFRAYELEAGEGMEDGGLEIELILDEKPQSNVFEFTIQTKELEFFYQPPLTQEEITQGASQPDDVVGSYAVYHKNKRDNRVGGMAYKTGKAFHIYRPFAYDANGDGVWCELSVDPESGILSVTIDEEWLKTAVYPVVVDPTFGFTSKGATSHSLGISNIADIVGSKFAATEAGTLTSISCYLEDGSNFPDFGGHPTWAELSGVTFIFAIYEDGTDGVLVDTTNEHTVNGSETNGFQELTFPATPANITAQNYWLYLWGDGGDSGFVMFFFDSTGGDSRAGNSSTYPNFPATLDDADFSNNAAWNVSIFATYTAGGGTDVTATPDAQASTVAVNSPTVTAERNVTITPNAQALTASAPDATVTTVRHVTVSPNAQAVTAAVNDPTITAEIPVTVSAGVQSVTASLADPTVTAEILTLAQEGYRFREDDGDEDGASWHEDQDTNLTFEKETPVRLRVLLNASGDPSSEQFRLEYRLKDSGNDWRAV